MKSKDLLNQLRWRYAVKKFDPTQKIPAETWKDIEESLRLTPSSYGMQPWKFLVIDNPELRKKLRAVSWNQSQVEESSHYVVMLGLKKVDEKEVDRFMNRITEVRGTSPESLAGFRKGIVGDLVTGGRSSIIAEWAARQVYIALGQAMATAAVLGVDACPLEGIDPIEYDKLLDLESTNYRSLCALAFGYRSAEDNFATLEKVRYELSEVIEHR